MTESNSKQSLSTDSNPNDPTVEKEAFSQGYQLGYTGGKLSKGNSRDTSPKGVAFTYGFIEGSQERLDDEYLREHPV